MLLEAEARTSIRDNLVVVLLEDTLTKGERRLVSKGREHRVIEFRHEFQDAMRGDAIASVKEMTGRKVTACLRRSTWPKAAAGPAYRTRQAGGHTGTMRGRDGVLSSECPFDVTCPK